MYDSRRLLCLRKDLRTQVEKTLESLPNPYIVTTKLTGLKPVFWYGGRRGDVHCD
jgi:hypothetical protein